MSNILAKTILYTIPEAGLEDYALITFEVNVPAFIWTELLTHKRIVRNASSNRALSVSKNIETLGYFKPDTFYKKGKGMQSGESIAPFSELDSYCVSVWNDVWEYCAKAAKNLEENGICKEQASRVLPTFKMMKGLVTGTLDAWKCFLELRDNFKADTAMQELAKQIRKLIENPDKDVYQISNIHLPMWRADYYTTNALLISAGRIARVSYLSNNISEEESDVKLGLRLIDDKHFSPIEHIAKWDVAFSQNTIFKSAICSKNDDIYFKNGRANHWINLRSWYEQYNNIDNFLDSIKEN